MDAIFFPRAQYEVEICAHRYGKSMTYTEQSDTFRGGAENIVSAFAQNDIKVGVFWGMSTGADYGAIALPYVNAGKMWIDAYCNPSGASGGGNINYETYIAQRNALLERIKDWFDKRPLALSFSYGNDSYADYAIMDFVGCRNSNKNVGTPYGIGYGSPNNIPYSQSYFKSKGSTSRWYDDAKVSGTFTQRLQQLEADVLVTKQNGGWYNNFTHWHNVISDDNLSHYISYVNLLATLNANDDIYFAGYGEAVAYLIYRQIITRAVMYSPKLNPNNQLIIRLETINNVGVNADLLQVPISIKFSLANTPLAGYNIRCDKNLIALGNNEYIVEIPFGRYPFAIIEKNGN